MTSKQKIVITSGVPKMSRFSQARLVKKYKFMNLDIDINKLSVNDVLAIQEQAKRAETSKEEAENLKLMTLVIRNGVSEMKEMSDEELFNLPMDELSKLSAEIMNFSGLGKSE